MSGLALLRSFGVRPVTPSGGGSPTFDIIGVGSDVDTLTTYPKTGPVTSGDVWVDFSAASNGSGTEVSPYDNLNDAYTAASAGDTIIVKGGTWTPSSRLRIQKANLSILNYGTDRPIIDGSSLGTTSNARVFTVEADGFHLKGFEIKNCDEHPVVTYNANGKYEDLHIHGCAKTNVYFYGSGATGNVAMDVWSWNVFGTNTVADDDDNFASSGDNSADASGSNVFVRCVGANGPDDAFDFFRGTGNSIKSCVAIGSGYYDDGSTAGDGNGFKMGGDVGGNSVEGSIAVGVRVQGFDANITTDSTLEFFRNTSVGAGVRGFNTYAAANGNIQENISVENGTEENSGVNDGTYNSWNASADAGSDPAFPLTLAEIDFADPTNYDYSLDTASEAIGAGVSGGNLGASSEALEILKDFMATYGAQVYHR